jgi:hypothetical protein
VDKLSSYRSVIKQVLSQHAEYIPSHGQIETIPLVDERNDNYLLVDVGWDRTGRVHCVALHLRIKDGKVWVEQDGTEEGVTEALLDAGIPKADIVLGFYRPERRKITDFAVV